MSDLHRDIKQLIIEALGLEDIGIDDIGDDQTLFGEGLGLDSVDARAWPGDPEKIWHQDRRRRQGHP